MLQMNGLLDQWAMLNTIVIMFALGMAYRPEPEQHQPGVITRAAIGYNLLLPALGLMVLTSITSWFAPETLTAMSLCIAAAGGTSAGAFANKIGASATLTATLIIVSLGLSLCVITGLSLMQRLDFGTLSMTALCFYLLMITLTPFFIGITLAKQWPQLSPVWQPRLERTGSVLVMLLVIALTWRYGAEILSGPAEPLWAAAALVMLFVLPPLLLERQAVLKKTIVLTTLIRNLTLAISLLALMPNAALLLPTVLAFGLFMYLLSGILVFYWRAE